MSLKLFVTALVLTTTATAFGAENIIGKYKAEKEIIVMSETKESCEGSEGRWQAEDEVCILKTSDDAEVSKSGKGLKLHVSTIGSNYHTCEFEGAARLVKNTLISRVVTEEYNHSTGQMVNVTCEVRAKIVAGEMEIKTNEHCQSFCGANAWLEVDGLKKVK